MNINAGWWTVQDLLDVLFSEAALREWIEYHGTKMPPHEVDRWVRDALDIRKGLGLTEDDAKKVLQRIGRKVYRLDLEPQHRLFLVAKLIPALVWAAAHKEGTRAGVPDVAERGGGKCRVTVRVPEELLPKGMTPTEAILAGLRLLQAQNTQGIVRKGPPKRI